MVLSLTRSVSQPRPPLAVVPVSRQHLSAVANTQLGEFYKSTDKHSNRLFSIPFKSSEKRQCCKDKVYATSKNCCKKDALVPIAEC